MQGNIIISSKLNRGGYGAMFRFTQDLNVPVTLEANQLTPQGVVSALSNALKCNVFIDGFIDDIPIGKPGVYRAQEVLNMAFKAWTCSGETEGKNICFLRDFTMKRSLMGKDEEGPFPAISWEEMAAFTRAISARFLQKYPSLSDQNRAVGIHDQLRALTQKMSPADQKRAESNNGIVIGSLPPPLQEEMGCKRASPDII